MNQTPDIPSSGNLPFVEQLYADFARDPASIAPEWRRYFETLKNGEPLIAPRFGPSFQAAGLFAARAVPASPEEKVDESKVAALQNRVNQLVRNYRVRGHNIAAIDPLGMPRPTPPELEMSFFGFSEEDMDLSLIHISEPTRQAEISYAVFCLTKK